MQGQWLSFLLFLFSTYKSWHPEGTRRLSRRAEINKTSAPSSYKSNLMRNKAGELGGDVREKQSNLSTKTVPGSVSRGLIYDFGRRWEKKHNCKSICFSLSQQYQLWQRTDKLNRDFKHFLIYLFFSSTCTLSDWEFNRLPKWLPTTVNAVLKDSGTLCNLDGKSASLYPQSVEINIHN